MRTNKESKDIKTSQEEGVVSRRLLECSQYLAVHALDIWKFADKCCKEDPVSLRIATKECKQLVAWSTMLLEISKTL